MKGTNVKKVERQKENCVICGKEIPYVFETNINDRSYYVEGCGQLCKGCFLQIKIDDMDED